MVTAELLLLGPPSLTIAGRPARLHSAKALALLAYLALDSRTWHSREKLAGLLWGESAEARARHSLRQALYSLRRALGDACLAFEAEAVAFRSCPEVWVDVLEFLDLGTARSPALNLTGLQRAASLYRGMLLEGLEPSDCPAFEEWLFFQRDALEQKAIGLHQVLADELLREGRHTEALAFAQRLVAFDPLHEGAHRRLMQLYAALGDRDAARRQYRLCAEVLSREMGVEPSSETQVLYRQLAAGPPSPPARPELPPAPQPGEPLPALPFVGRERELATLQSWLQQAMAGQGRLLLVAGEAGLGKTRLMIEFLRRSSQSAARPLRWLAARGYRPEAHAPYTVWGDALQPLSRPEWQPLVAGLAEVWRRQLARLVPELGPPAGDVEGATLAESRLRLHQGVVHSLIHLACSGPLLLWFDDLQWADEASLELLHYVARHGTDCPLLIVGSYRETPDLNHLLSGIDPAVERAAIELEPLDQATIAHLLSHWGTSWPADLPVRLYQHTAGNPLLLVETLHALVEARLLWREPDGRLVEAKVTPWPVPRRVHDLIQARLAPLGEEQRRVLAAGAVVGRAFDLPLLRRVSGLPELHLARVVEQLLARTILDERAASPPGQALDFHHDYFRRVIYTGLSDIQRQALHRRAARALLQLHRARPGAVTEEVAYHLEQASDPQAIGYLTQAAQAATDLFAYQHAANLLSRALALYGIHRADEPAGRFDLLLAREAVLDRQGRRSEQAEDVAALLELAQALGDATRLALACVRQAGLLTYTRQYAQARRAGEQALGLYREAGDPAGEAQALRELGFLHWSAGDYGTALAYGQDALHVHRRLSDMEGEATALHNLAEITRSLGSPRQALAQYEGALHLHWARQDRRRQGLTLYGMAHAWRQLGNFDQALARYEQALAHCQAAGDRLMASRAYHALAGLHWEAGALAPALEHLGRALDISQEIGYGPGIAHGLLALGHVEASDGRLDAARQHLQEAMTWLRLMEDQARLAQAESMLRGLEQGTLPDGELPATLGWVKTHVALAEGKVYCEFESPVALSFRDD